MDNKEQEFRKRLHSTFKKEADEHVKVISAGLTELEKLPTASIQSEITETVYRRCHSMKGAARAVNMSDIETICHSLEDIFSSWKQQGVRHSRALFDSIYDSLNTIRIIIHRTEEDQPAMGKVHVSRVIRDIEASARIAEHDFHTPGKGGLSSHATASRGISIPYTSDSVRISAGKLNTVLLLSEEMLSVKEASHLQLVSLLEIASSIDTLKKECSVSTPDSLTVLDKKVVNLIRSSRQQNRTAGRMVDNLLDEMKKTMLLPFSTLLEGFPLLIRNLSVEGDKEADLAIDGDGIEIDRRILEEMKDPLIHLVRNSIGHGLEEPDARLKNNKPRRGTIKIAISQLRGDMVEITVADDGAGIDIARVKEEAVRNGEISPEDAGILRDDEALHLIFRSGVSTSPIISDISGRGLGLAIVREKVERLGGAVSLESHCGTGTVFHIILPLTVATIRGILVRASDQVFAVPTSNVERCARIKDDDIRTVENRETIILNGRPVSFVRLGSVLELPYRKNVKENRFTPVIVLRSADKQIAVGIDEVLAEHEVLVKGLGRQLSKVRNISGVAIPGSGKAVPILNVPDLIRTAVKAPQPLPIITASPEKEGKAGKGYILVVEDSITSRILLKNILETAGYRVRTAIDGIDAMTTLKNEEFDLVVSDIEMPGMNGFDLTAKIRSDKRLADLPVVLVTALERREDREHGIEVQADAYIVKSSFDQSNLLEIVRRLI